MLNCLARCDIVVNKGSAVCCITLLGWPERTGRGVGIGKNEKNCVSVVVKTVFFCNCQTSMRRHLVCPLLVTF